MKRGKETMKELEFKNVYGYQEVKDELNRIKSWYEDETILNNPKITLPKGILLYGRPGNGKTLFVREFLNNFDAPKFIIEGRNENTALEIKRVFEKAKKEKFAIVVIDELELLVPENSKEQRILQQELDGVVQKGRILVLATANSINKVGDPLLRPGRFDKKIDIAKPDRQSRKEIFKYMLNDLGIDVSHINFDHVSKHCSGVSGATIKAICNDVYLRSNGKDITEEEIETSYERVSEGNLGSTPVTENSYKVAIHEAGHSLLAVHFRENWSFYKAKFEKSGGLTETEEVVEDVVTFKKREQEIMIGLGGYVAERIIFGHHDYGSASDFEKVHDLCRRLVERSCIYGLQYHITCSIEENNYHRETHQQAKKIERKTYSLMNKYQRKVSWFMFKHKKELKRFAEYMCEHNGVSYRDINKLGLSEI